VSLRCYFDDSDHSQGCHIDEYIDTGLAQIITAHAAKLYRVIVLFQFIYQPGRMRITGCFTGDDNDIFVRGVIIAAHFAFIGIVFYYEAHHAAEIKKNNTVMKITLQEDLPLITGLLAGTDEAGRGPLAGNVVAAAVILNAQNPIIGLDDSKKLTQSTLLAGGEYLCATDRRDEYSAGVSVRDENSGGETGTRTSAYLCRRQ